MNRNRRMAGAVLTSILTMTFYSGVGIASAQTIPSAAPMQGSGTASNPYLITSVAQWDMIRQHPNSDYILVDNLDFEGQTPTQIVGFAGVLNGDGHTVSDATVPESISALTHQPSVGLFSDFMGTIKNLTIANSTATVPEQTAASIENGYGQEKNSSGELELEYAENAGVLMSSDYAGHVQNVSMDNDTISAPGADVFDDIGVLAGFSNGSLRDVQVTGGSVQADPAYNTDDQIGGVVGVLESSASRPDNTEALQTSGESITVTTQDTTAYGASDTALAVSPDVGGVIGYVQISSNQSERSTVADIQSGTEVLLNADALPAATDQTYSISVGGAIGEAVAHGGSSLLLDHITSSAPIGYVNKNSGSSSATYPLEFVYEGGVVGELSGSGQTQADHLSSAAPVATTLCINSNEDVEPYLGGLVGALNASSTALQDSAFSGTIITNAQTLNTTGNELNVGGVTGFNGGLLSHVTSAAKINVTIPQYCAEVGGLAGTNNDAIQGSESDNTMTINDSPEIEAGGLSGDNSASETADVALGTLTVDNSPDALVGGADGMSGLDSGLNTDVNMTVDGGIGDLVGGVAGGDGGSATINQVTNQSHMTILSSSSYPSWDMSVGGFVGQYSLQQPPFSPFENSASTGTIQLQGRGYSEVAVGGMVGSVGDGSGGSVTGGGSNGYALENDQSTSSISLPYAAHMYAGGAIGYNTIFEAANNLQVAGSLTNTSSTSSGGNGLGGLVGNGDYLEVSGGSVSALNSVVTTHLIGPDISTAGGGISAPTQSDPIDPANDYADSADTGVTTSDGDTLFNASSSSGTFDSLDSGWSSGSGANPPHLTVDFAALDNGVNHLSEAVAGVPFSQTLYGGTAYAIVQGPSFVHITGDTLSGTAPTAGEYPLVIAVTGWNGQSSQVSIDLPVAYAAPQLSTSNVTTTGLTVTANGTSGETVDFLRNGQTESTATGVETYSGLTPDLDETVVAQVIDSTHPTLDSAFSSLSQALPLQQVTKIGFGLGANPVVGTTVPFDFTALDQDGAPVLGAAVVFSAERGSMTQDTAYTDATGLASSAIILPTKSGSDTITVQVTDTSGSTHAYPYTFTVEPGPPTNLAVYSVYGVHGGTSTEVYGVLTDVYGNPTTGDYVYGDVPPDGGGSLAPNGAVLTNENGEFVFEYSAPNASGVYPVNVSYDGVTATGYVYVTVVQTPPPTPPATVSSDSGSTPPRSGQHHISSPYPAPPAAQPNSGSPAPAVVSAKSQWTNSTNAKHTVAQVSPNRPLHLVATVDPATGSRVVITAPAGTFAKKGAVEVSIPTSDDALADVGLTYQDKLDNKPIVLSVQSPYISDLDSVIAKKPRQASVPVTNATFAGTTVTIDVLSGADYSVVPPQPTHVDHWLLIWQGTQTYTAPGVFETSNSYIPIYYLDHHPMNGVASWEDPEWQITSIGGKVLTPRAKTHWWPDSYSGHFTEYVNAKTALDALQKAGYLVRIIGRDFMVGVH